MLKVGTVYEVKPRLRVEINGITKNEDFFAKLIGFSSKGAPVFEIRPGEFRAYEIDGVWGAEIVPLKSAPKKPKGCKGKKIHETEESAQAFCDQLNIREQHFNVYPCTACGKWHVGHIPRAKEG